MKKLTLACFIALASLGCKEETPVKVDPTGVYIGKQVQYLSTIDKNASVGHVSFRVTRNSDNSLRIEQTGSATAYDFESATGNYETYEDPGFPAVRSVSRNLIIGNGYLHIRSKNGWIDIYAEK